MRAGGLRDRGRLDGDGGEPARDPLAEARRLTELLPNTIVDGARTARSRPGGEDGRLADGRRHQGRGHDSTLDPTERAARLMETTRDASGTPDPALDVLHRAEGGQARARLDVEEVEVEDPARRPAGVDLENAHLARLAVDEHVHGEPSREGVLSRAHDRKHGAQARDDARLERGVDEGLPDSHEAPDVVLLVDGVHELEVHVHREDGVRGEARADVEHDAHVHPLVVVEPRLHDHAPVLAPREPDEVQDQERFRVTGGVIAEGTEVDRAGAQRAPVAPLHLHDEREVAEGTDGGSAEHAVLPPSGEDHARTRSDLREIGALASDEELRPHDPVAREPIAQTGRRHPLAERHLVAPVAVEGGVQGVRPVEAELGEEALLVPAPDVEADLPALVQNEVRDLSPEAQVLERPVDDVVPLDQFVVGRLDAGGDERPQVALELPRGEHACGADEQPARHSEEPRPVVVEPVDLVLHEPPEVGHAHEPDDLAFCEGLLALAPALCGDHCICGSCGHVRLPTCSPFFVNEKGLPCGAPLCTILQKREWDEEGLRNDWKSNHKPAKSRCLCPLELVRGLHIFL